MLTDWSGTPPEQRFLHCYTVLNKVCGRQSMTAYNKRFRLVTSTFHYFITSSYLFLFLFLCSLLSLLHPICTLCLVPLFIYLFIYPLFSPSLYFLFPDLIHFIFPFFISFILFPYFSSSVPPSFLPSFLSCVLLSFLSSSHFFLNSPLWFLLSLLPLLTISFFMPLFL